MHLLYLGVCRDLYASALGCWIRGGYYTPGSSLEENLMEFSLEMRAAMKADKLFGGDVSLVFPYMSAAD